MKTTTFDHRAVDALREVIAARGIAFAAEPARLGALLRDMVGGATREISLIVTAAEAAVASDVAASGLDPIRVGPLVRRLTETKGLTDESAAWAVAAWMQALDGTPVEAPPRPILTPTVLDTELQLPGRPDLGDGGSPPTPRPARSALRKIVVGVAILAVLVTATLYWLSQDPPLSEAGIDGTYAGSVVLLDEQGFDEPLEDQYDHIAEWRFTPQDGCDEGPCGLSWRSEHPYPYEGATYSGPLSWDGQSYDGTAAQRYSGVTYCADADDVDNDGVTDEDIPLSYYQETIQVRVQVDAAERNAAGAWVATAISGTIEVSWPEGQCMAGSLSFVFHADLAT